MCSWKLSWSIIWAVKDTNLLVTFASRCILSSICQNLLQQIHLQQLERSCRKECGTKLGQERDNSFVFSLKRNNYGNDFFRLSTGGIPCRKIFVCSFLCHQSRDGQPRAQTYQSEPGWQGTVILLYLCPRKTIPPHAHNLSTFSFPFSIFSIFAPLYFLILGAGDMAKK